MTLSQQRIFRSTPYANRTTTGTLLTSDLELSLWGGVDPKTGEVIDRFHPLSGRCLKDTILAVPRGRGSCGISVMMMELIVNGMGSKALIFQRREEIITLGVMVAEELFAKTAAVVTLSPDDFREFLGLDKEVVHIQDEQVSNRPLMSNTGNGTPRLVTDANKFGVQLTQDNHGMLNGVNHGSEP